MGAHFYIVNPRKREYLDPEKFRDGPRLLEFGSSGCGTMLALAALLTDGSGFTSGEIPGENPIVGSWAGDAIVITGDGSDPGNHVGEDDVLGWRIRVARDAKYREYLRSVGKRPEDLLPNLYTVAHTIYKDVSADVIAALCNDPYTRKALIERGVEAAKTWEPTPDAFTLD